MLHGIGNMYGPLFILFYMAFCAVVIMVARLVSAALQYDPAHLPAVTPLPDPYQIAYLRGGPRAVTNLAILQLLEEGCLELREDTLHMAKGRHRPPISDARAIQTAVWYEFSSPKLATALPEIALQIEPMCIPLKRDLYHNRLLQTHNQRVVGLVIMALAATIIAIMGLFKLITALNNGHHNVGFLVILMVLQPALTIRMCYPKLASWRGRKYLRRLQTAYSQLQHGDYSQDCGAGISTVMLVGAVFGVSRMDGEIYGPLASYLKAPLHANWSDSSGLSNCAAVGSCAGGASCGGGGCGGCGGGN